MTDELEAVVDEEERIFRELFEGVDTYRAWVPREADWGETGLDREMVELVESLGEGPRAKAAE